MIDAEVRVLVVHSNAADLAVLASVVAAHAFDLRVIESSADLAAEVARYQPDAIVLDVQQRRGDGYELCRALKSDPATAPVPVILIGSLDEARRRAFAVGCDDFLDKPINRHLLAHRLRSFARLRRAWQAGVRGARAGSPGPRSDDRLIRMCAGFGRHLELSEPEQLALEQAAVLRDIIEVHPEIGAELLQRLPDTELLVAIVRHRRADADADANADAEPAPRVARVFRALDRFDELSRECDDDAGALATAASPGSGLDPDVIGALTAWLGARASS